MTDSLDSMNSPVVSRADWLVARNELLIAEKAHTRARAALAEKRRTLPRVLIEKDYLLGSQEGQITLAAAFTDVSQLVVYHLMFGSDWEAPCIGCAAWANDFNGTTAQYRRADARLVAVSSAPIEKLAIEAKKRGWDFPWLSSHEQDFNYDFYGSSRDLSPRSSRRIGGPDGELVEFDRGENHGVSVFQKDPDGSVYHTYSSYNRGIEALNGSMGYFDLLPKGRAW